MKKEKNAIIFGGSSDIGVGIIHALEKHYNINYTYYSNKQVDVKHKSFKCDLRDIENIQNIFDELSDIDLIVTSSFPFISTDPLNFTHYIEIESFLKGHIKIICEGAKKLNKGGKIINILGQSADYGLPSAPHYSASFSYLDNMSKSINATYGRKGVFSIHNLLLGPVETKLWNGVSDGEREAFNKRVVKFTLPKQIGQEVLHIASSEVGPTKIVLDSFYSLPM